MFYEEDVSTQTFLIDKSNEESTDELKKEKDEKIRCNGRILYLESCYREYILKYFGDKRIKNYCGKSVEIEKL